LTPAPTPDDSIVSTLSKNEVDLIASRGLAEGGGLANGFEGWDFLANGFFAGSAFVSLSHTFLENIANTSQKNNGRDET